MKKTICILHPADWQESTSYAVAFVEALNRIKNPDTEYFFKPCPPGLGKFPVIDYFMDALEIPKLCAGAINAEKEGADAIIIACTDDPGLRIIRTLVDIPVIGEVESSLYLASMIGHRFGLVSWPNRAFMNRGEDLIRNYGLEGKAVNQPTEPVVTPSPTAEKTARKGFLDPAGFCREYVLPAANRLIQRGADVIVMHSTGLSLIAEAARFSRIDKPDVPLDSGKAGIPVINAVSAAMKMAELRVDLHKVLGLPSASRLGVYQLARDAVDQKQFDEMVASFK